MEGADGQPDNNVLEALREQLAKTNAELTAAKANEALLEARLNTAMWDHNTVSTTKDIKHNAELATLTEQYETESTATSEKSRVYSHKTWHWKQTRRPCRLTTTI